MPANQDAVKFSAEPGSLLYILLVYQHLLDLHVADKAVLDLVINLRWSSRRSRSSRRIFWQILRRIHTWFDRQILYLKTLTTAFEIAFAVVDCVACGILASPECCACVLLVFRESVAVSLYFDHALVGLVAVAAGGLG